MPSANGGGGPGSSFFAFVLVDVCLLRFVAAVDWSGWVCEGVGSTRSGGPTTAVLSKEILCNFPIFCPIFDLGDSGWRLAASMCKAASGRAASPRCDVDEEQ